VRPEQVWSVHPPRLVLEHHAANRTAPEWIVARLATRRAFEGLRETGGEQRQPPFELFDPRAPRRAPQCDARPTPGTRSTRPPCVESQRWYARQTTLGGWQMPRSIDLLCARKSPSAVKSVIWVSSVIAPTRP
jgi:hypothetical protein